MLTSEEALNAVKKRFEFDRWAGTNTLRRGLFLQNYRLPESFGPWRLARVDRVPAEAGWPATLHTMWVDPQQQSETLLRVELHECRSRLAAHDFFLRLLAEQQLESFERVEQGPIGDVQFISASSELAIFARANVVLFIARAGAVSVAATQVAGSIDAHVVAEPAPAAGAVKIRRAAMAKVVALASAPALDVRIAGGGAEPPTIKIFSEGGEAESGAEGLRFVPNRTGPAKMTVYAIGAGSDAVAKKVVLVEVTE